jgi:hypothetical protein
MRFITEGSTDRQTQIAAEETDRAALELKVQQSAHAKEALSAEAQQALKELRALGEDCCPEIDLDDIALELEPLGSGRYGEPRAPLLSACGTCALLHSLSHSLYHTCTLVNTALLAPGVVYRGTFGQTGVAVKKLQHNHSAAVSDFRREVPQHAAEE